MIRLIIRDAYQRNPKPLPVIVFLHCDHTGQPRHELVKLVDDFLETSGVVFGIRDDRSAVLHFLIGEQAKIMQYTRSESAIALEPPPERRHIPGQSDVGATKVQ